MHGQAAISNIVVNSNIIKEKFCVRVVSLQFAKTMQDLGMMTFAKLLKMIRIAFEIRSAIRDFNPNIIYFSISPKGLSFFRDVVYVSIMKRHNSKIVYHLHVKGIQEEGRNNRIKKMLYKWVLKDTHVITLSHTIASDLNEVYKGEPFIVNNGIASVAVNRPAMEIPPFEKPVLLYLSNLTYAKGIFVLLEALALLKKNHLDFYARIIGMPSDVSAEEIKRFVQENGMEDSVAVEGPKYGEEKYDALRTADIFIHPTLNDAFPLVILEAMQFSLPVVSTIEGSIPEIVDDGITGVLVPKSDSQALMDKIAWLMSDHRRREEMGKAGRRKFLSRYTSEQMEQNLRDVLLKISDIENES